MSTESGKITSSIAILGGGPGGFAAALRARELGYDTVLIDSRKSLGGTCINEGCIPAKALNHAMSVIREARSAESIGIRYEEPEIDIESIREWKNKIVKGLSSGAERAIKRAGVNLVRGHGRFESPKRIAIKNGPRIEFEHAIIATGSRIKAFPDWYVPGIWTTGKAVALGEIPESMLVVGTIFYGLELAMFYSTLGTKVTVLETGEQVLEEADNDLVNALLKNCRSKFDEVITGASIRSAEKTDDSFSVRIDDSSGSRDMEFHRILLAHGRRPNTDNTGIENTGITPDPEGYIDVSMEGRTSEGHIFAVGDVVRGPMMTHFASWTGKLAVDTISGGELQLDYPIVPGVAFTEPQVAWTGITEKEAMKAGVEYRIGKYPMAALAGAIAQDKSEGFAKILFDPESRAILGVGLVGSHAGELISEGTLAIRMCATLDDLIETLHLHPTLSESIMEAAKVGAAKHDRSARS